MIIIYKIFQDINKENLKEYYNFNIIFFNYRNIMIYSLLFSMQIDYIKNIILIFEFILNLIIFNRYKYIKQNYELNNIINFKI